MHFVHANNTILEKMQAFVEMQVRKIGQPFHLDDQDDDGVSESDEDGMDAYKIDAESDSEQLETNDADFVILD